MNPKTPHTPTPWQIHSEAEAFAIVAPWGENVKPGEYEGYGDYRGGIIAKLEHQGLSAPVVTSRQAKANAAFIVRAVNSHEKLISLLSDCADFCFEKAPDGLPYYNELGKRIEKAIANAEGEE